MGQLSDDDVAKILKLVEESSFSEMHLEIDDLKLIFKKKGTTSYIEKTENSPEVEKELIAVEETALTPLKNSYGEGKVSVTPIGEIGQAGFDKGVYFEEEGCFPIKAPLLGTFYRFPRPGAPPFVEIGKFVEENETVCIIEVMKNMNQVKAGVRGRIVKICVENGQMVEYQQTLLLVKPEGTSEKKLSNL